MGSQGLSTLEKSDVAREIATHLGVDYRRILERRMLQIVSYDEASQLSRAGIDLQLHTHRHRTPTDRELFRREIRDNSAVVTELSGKRPSHFCYPSGHHLPEFLPWLQELDIESATTCEKGLAAPESPDLILPRVLDDVTVDPVRFESLVAGLFA
jgi:peptidoglycan/xylan/chitin deacetylase (PgdA/CDA1 family)